MRIFGFDISRAGERRAIGPAELFGPGWKSLGSTRAPAVQAEALTAFHRCVQLVASSISTLPVHVYQRGPSADAAVPAHPLQSVIYRSPNPRMTPVVFWHTVLESLLIHGNAFVEVAKDASGRVLELWPLVPAAVRVEVNSDGSPRYRYQPTSGRRVRVLDADRVMHVVGPGYDGLVGRSVLEQFAEVLAIAASMDGFAEAFWRHGAALGAVLQHPGSMSPEAATRLVQQFNERFAGPGNAGRTILLQEGMKVDRMDVDLTKADLTSQRTWVVREVCRIYGVPPHMCGDLEKASYASIEAQGLDFLKYCLRPWIVRLEQAANRALLADDQHYIKWKVDGLLRSSTAERYRAYATGRTNGWLSVNEIRALEDLPPIEGGDAYLQPLNMAPVGEEEVDDEG